MGSGSPPENENAPINIRGKNKLNKIDCRSLKKIRRKTFARCS
jgi:hypothetical protein